MTREWPLPWERVISLPGTPCPWASCSNTVMVEEATPLSGTLVGLAKMPAAAGGGAMNCTVAVWVSVTPSVTSLAVKVTFSTVASVTVNTTAPLATVETPLAGVITAWLPALAASVTVFPGTMLPSVSRSRTTIAAAVAPSAGMVPRNGTKGVGREAVTEETVGSAGPGARPASARFSRFTLGEPNPTCAGSLPILAAEWKALVPARG